MNLTHHGALSTPPPHPSRQQPAVRSIRHGPLVYEKKEKPECFRLLVKREFIIQLPAYCRREKVGASSSTLDSEKSPANIFSLSSLPAAGVIPRLARDVPCQIFLIEGGLKKKEKRFWFGLYLVRWMTLSVPLSAGCQHVFHQFSPPPPSPSPVSIPWCLIHAVSDVV